MAGDDNHDGDHPETSNTSSPIPPPTQQIPHTNGNGPVSVTTYTNGMIKVLPLKTAKEVVAREKERKARTTLLMALPEDHLAKFYKMADAKEMWEAIKSRFEGLYKGYDRFQTLLSQLEIYGAGVNIRLDTFSFDDLYNNLRVFERDVKGTTASSSNTQNVAFVSADNTSSTNDVSTAYSISSPSISKSQKEGSSSYIDEVIRSFFVAMISMRIKKFHKRTGQKLQFDTKDPVGFDKPKVECFNCHKMRHFARDCRAKRTKTTKEEMLGTMATKLETMEDAQNYAMMAYSSSNSGSDNEIKSCSKACEESYARLKKLYDEQRDKLGNASVEITAYALALKKVETQLLCHQQNQLAYEQKIRLLNIQMSANDKFGLRYGDYRYGSILRYKNEVLHSVFMNKASDLEDTPVNDRYNDGMHAVPLPMTGNYMPSRPDVEMDYSKFTYAPKQTSADESDSKPSEYTSYESDSSVETSTSMPEPVKNAPKVVCEPKVWTGAPIVEEYKSDSDIDSVSNIQEDKEKHSFAFTNSVKNVKTSRENIKETSTTNHNPKIKKHDRNAHTGKGLGYAFTRKACFDDPHRALKDKGIVDSGCSRHMTGNKAHLADYQKFKGDSFAFGGSNGRKIGKGKIKKNKVLFTDTDCLVLSHDFKLPDENQVLLKIPRKHNMYSFNLKNIYPSGDLACLFPKASIDESNKWHQRLGHENFKNLNKLVKGDLVRVENQVNKSAGPKEANNSAGTQANDDQGANSKEINLYEEHFILPIWSAYSTTIKSSEEKIEKNTDFKSCEKPVSQLEQIFLEELEKLKSVVTDFDNLETTVNVSPTPTTRIHTIHPKTQILVDPMSAVQTRSKMNKNSEAHALISQALEDESWVDAMQEELPQFQIQKVWILVDLPFGKKAITKWVYRNKKDERSVVVRNKARLVAQGHR
nr:ribonuclease H-like domain-containing protein [Tanacetum cinerariifolium]